MRRMDGHGAGSTPGACGLGGRVIRRAVLLCEDVIEPQHLIFDENNNNYSTPDSEFVVDTQVPLREITKQVQEKVEKEAITNALRQTKGNKSKAAKMLDVDYKTLLTKIKNYSIKKNPQ